MVIARSTAASSSPTSTLTPLEKLPPLVPPPVTPPATLCRNPPTAAEVPPPICTFSTSCAAMPAIWATTVLLIVVLPISPFNGLPPLRSLMLVLSDSFVPPGGEVCAPLRTVLPTPLFKILNSAPSHAYVGYSSREYVQEKQNPAETRPRRSSGGRI